jgi:hypothetical protein
MSQKILRNKMRLPYFTETKTTPSLHVERAEFNLNTFSNIFRAKVGTEL